MNRQRAVITNAGALNPNVTALVYASAFAPNQEVLGQFQGGPGTANIYAVTYPNNFGTFVFINKKPVNVEALPRESAKHHLGRVCLRQTMLSLIELSPGSIALREIIRKLYNS